MAKVMYQIVKKPLDERIIDAACIYWNVDRTYFAQKGGRDESTVFYRKSVIYYLIKQHTVYSLSEMARRFGYFGHAAVRRSIDLIEAHKNIYKQVNSDLNQILHLADKLDAEFIEREIVIENRPVDFNPELWQQQNSL